MSRIAPSTEIQSGNLDYQKITSQADDALHDPEFLEHMAGAFPNVDIQSIVPEAWEINAGCTVYSLAILNVKRYWEDLKKWIDAGNESSISHPTAVGPPGTGPLTTDAMKQWMMAVILSNEIIDCVKERMKGRGAPPSSQPGHEGVGGHTGWPSSPGSTGIGIVALQNYVIPCKLRAIRKRRIYPRYKGVGFVNGQTGGTTGWNVPPFKPPIPGPSPYEQEWVPWSEWVTRPAGSVGAPLTLARCPCVACPKGTPEKPECFITLSFTQMVNTGQPSVIGPDGRPLPPGPTGQGHTVTAKIIECDSKTGKMKVELIDIVGIQTSTIGPSPFTWPSSGELELTGPRERTTPVGIVPGSVKPNPDLYTPEEQQAMRDWYDPPIENLAVLVTTSMCDTGAAR